METMDIRMQIYNTRQKTLLRSNSIQNLCRFYLQISLAICYNREGRSVRIYFPESYKKQPKNQLRSIYGHFGKNKYFSLKTDRNGKHQ